MANPKLILLSTMRDATDAPKEWKLTGVEER